jgi:hypothetical protein
MLLGLLLLPQRGQRTLQLQRLRRRRPHGRTRRRLPQLQVRRHRLLQGLLLLELRLLHGRRGQRRRRQRRHRPNGRMGRLLLRRLARRPVRVQPLLLPREVRARVGSRSDCGGSIAGQMQFAGVKGVKGRIVAVKQLAALLLNAPLLCFLLVLLICCSSGERDLEHGEHSDHRSMVAVSPGISQV